MSTSYLPVPVPLTPDDDLYNGELCRLGCAVTLPLPVTLTDTELLTLLGFTSTRDQLLIMGLAREKEMTVAQAFTQAMRHYQAQCVVGPDHTVMIGRLVGPSTP